MEYDDDNDNGVKQCGTYVEDKTRWIDDKRFIRIAGEVEINNNKKK
jgi:hypothetical protein